MLGSAPLQLTVGMTERQSAGEKRILPEPRGTVSLDPSQKHDLANPEVY